MTNQTNGASLEDCHTNFFALVSFDSVKFSPHQFLFSCKVVPAKRTLKKMKILFTVVNVKKKKQSSGVDGKNAYKKKSIDFRSFFSASAAGSLKNLLPTHT